MKKLFVLWSSQAASLFGSAVVQFALAWYLARETGSATVLSTALIVGIIPYVVLGPFVGPLIDRLSRKHIMIYADLFTAALTAVLVVLFYTGNIEVWHIYLIMAGRSIGDVFQNPALSAAIPLIVQEKDLVRANGLFQMLQSAIKIVAPLAGAFCMETLDMQWVLSIDVFTAVIAVGCLLPLRIPQPPRTTLTEKPNYFADLKQGFAYIWARPGLAMLIGLVTLLVFFAVPASALFPIMVQTHLEGNVIMLGWVGTSMGIGGILGGLIMSSWGGFKKRIHTAVFGFAIMIPCSVGIGLTSVDIFYSTTVPAMIIMGIGNTFIAASLTAIMNSVVAKDIQGRVFAIHGSVVTLAMPIGLLIAGPLVDAYDIRWLYFIASAAWFVILLLALVAKPLMNVEKLKTEQPPAQDTA